MQGCFQFLNICKVISLYYFYYFYANVFPRITVSHWVLFEYYFHCEIIHVS